MMKRFAIILTVLATAASCGTNHKSDIQRKVEDYAIMTIPAPDLSGISANGKEVLNLYRFAADETDKIYWKQFFGDKTLMTEIKDPATREYAMINYGPWDRLDGKAFVAGYGQRPAGANFYPSDMTAEEFDKFADPDKDSPYTLIRRNEDGSLKTVWFHDEYAEHIQKICNYLEAAADITIKPSVRNYLLKKIDALRTDNYYESELAWLEMADSKMDLIIGPNENNDDMLYGTKRSYEAFVLLKDTTVTAQLNKYVAFLPELQKDLPCHEDYKAFTPGMESNIFACNALYYAGGANAGIKVIARNLPYDHNVQAEKGTRSILLKNIMEEKFHRIVLPSGIVLLDKDQRGHLDADAFFWNIAFREVAHGLGVKETVNGKGSVMEALGNAALTWEEAKGNILGLYLLCKLIEKHDIFSLITKEDAITTFFANLVRSERFGTGEARGRANIMCYNYLSSKGAFTRNESGNYIIDYSKTIEAITELSGLILQTQATGDYDFAKKFENEFGGISDNFKADLVNLRLENIPIDLRFSFE